jgi:VWFA-related protein
MKIPLAAALACLFGAAIAARGQTSQTSPAPPPTFRAGVELVRLDIRVVDADGRPVRDLRQDEVEVVEHGERRPVVFFQHIEEPTESYAEVASHTVAGEVSTNQGAARRHLYVLVFDQLHLAPGNEQRARQAAERFIQTRLRPGDRIGLYALPGPGPQLPFTSDRRRIVTELTKIRGMASPEAFGALGTMTVHEAFQIVRGDPRILERVAERFQSLAAPTDVQRRTDTTSLGSNTTPLGILVKEDARRIAEASDGDARRVLSMLTDILRSFRGLDGRKSVLLVSEGFYGDRLTRELEGVAAAAAESYSVIHPLDMNRRGPDITADEPAAEDLAAGIQDRIGPLGSLAAETGGLLTIDASQHADDAFGAVADQSNDYYLVGFTPGNDALADRGGYRPVTVRVRRGGANVSTRTGFVLTDAAARMDRHQSMERAMNAPFSQQGLPLRYTTYVLRGTTSGGQRVIVSLAADLPVGPTDRSQTADVAFVVRSAGDGRVVASGRDTMPLPARRAGNTTTGAGAYHVQFEAPAGEYVMRVVVREPGGLVGSADRRFTVRALDGPALTSGDLVLSAVRGELPARPAAYTGDGLTGVLELYARTVDQLRDARVTVDLVPVGSTSAAVSSLADLQEIRPTAGGAAREARVALPLTGVVPGVYIARARVTVGQDTVTEVAREVDIRQGERFRDADAEPAPAFDPREIVNGALGRDYAQSLKSRSSPAALDALRGLDRLAASDFPVAIAAFQSALSSPSGGGAPRVVASGGGAPRASAIKEDALAAFFLGWAFHGAGDDRQAISAWRRAAFLDPSIVPAHLALADMYLELSQPALAIQALRAGLAAQPDSPELRDRLSRLEQR